MTLPPLYALRAFACAAQAGSFSRAAALLNVTPGAISRHVRSLEAWFDCKLFVRNGPKVELSPAGSLLAMQIQEGFDGIERACAMFSQRNNLLRLKAPTTITMRWLLNELRCFDQQNGPAEATNLQHVDECRPGGLPARTLRLRDPVSQW